MTSTESPPRCVWAASLQWVIPHRYNHACTVREKGASTGRRGEAVHLHLKLHHLLESSLPPPCPGGLTQGSGTPEHQLPGPWPGSREVGLDLEMLDHYGFGGRYWCPGHSTSVAHAAVHACIMVEFAPFHVCQGQLSAHPNQAAGRPLLDTPPLASWQRPSLYTQLCLAVRLCGLRGVPLADLAFCVCKSFFPRPCISHRGCSFKAPELPWQQGNSEQPGAPQVRRGVSSWGGLALAIPSTQLPAPSSWRNSEAECV